MTRYEIKVSSLEHNINEVKRRAGVPVWGVVKFDGYSMGLEFMAKLLVKNGIDRLAVVEPKEALSLRNAGITGDILLLRPLAEDSEIKRMIEENVILAVGSEEYLQRVSKTAEAMNKTARIHIKIDTGFNRYGYKSGEYESVCKAYKTPFVRAEGIMSHFSSAFRSEETTRAQYDEFVSLLKKLKEDSIDRGMAHISNSAAIYCYDDMRLDAVRVGSAFLGRVAAKHEDAKRLERVGILKSEIVSIKELKQGEKLGYGGKAQTEKDTLSAVVPFGLRDGLNSDMVYAMVKTKSTLTKAPLLGAPSTGHVILDITDTDANVGDEVRVDFNPLFLNPLVEKKYL